MLRFKFSIFALLFTLMGSFVWAQNPLNLSYKGLSDGHHVSHYDNGNVQGDMTIRNGNLVGEHIVYYSNGIIENYDQFDKGMFHGLSFKLKNNGDTIRRSHYSHDTLMYDKGFWYYPSGNLKSIRIDVFFPNSLWGKEFFKKPRITNNHVNWDSQGQFDSSSYCMVLEYFENGNLKSTSEYCKNKRQGIYQEYYTTGILKLDAMCKNDEHEGSYFEYYPDGKKKIEAFCVNGKYHGEYKEFLPDGELKKTAIYENGRIKK